MSFRTISWFCGNGPEAEWKIGEFIIHETGKNPANTLLLTSSSQLIKYETYPELCNVIGTKYGTKEVKPESVLEKEGYYETVLKTAGYYKEHVCGGTTPNQKGVVKVRNIYGTLDETETEYNCVYSGNAPYYPVNYTNKRWSLSKPFVLNKQFTVTQINPTTQAVVQRKIEYHDPAGDRYGWDNNYPEEGNNHYLGHYCTSSCRTYYEDVSWQYKVIALTNYKSVNTKCDLSYVQPVYEQRWVDPVYKTVNKDYYRIPSAREANQQVDILPGLSVSIIYKNK